MSGGTLRFFGVSLQTYTQRTKAPIHAFDSRNASDCIQLAKLTPSIGASLLEPAFCVGRGEVRGFFLGSQADVLLRAGNLQNSMLIVIGPLSERVETSVKGAGFPDFFRRFLGLRGIMF